MLFDWAEKNPALTQGLLAAAFGAMAGRGSRTQALGQGGLAGLLGYSNAQGQMANAEKEKEAQRYRSLQLGQLEAQIAQQQKDRDATRSAFAPTSPTQALAGGGGPTPANAERVGQMPKFDPRNMLAAGASPEAVAQAMQINSSLNPAPKLRDVAPGAVLIDERTGKEVFRAPERENLDSLIVKGPDGRPMLNQLAFEAKQRLARAGAANNNVSINTGQKGFDNTLKLRGDFRSEPIYKAHQDVQSAYAQITAAIKKESPAGDLAAATKIMKILDPGSVVRESELGMAMAATGLLDRAMNYAQMVATGNKLTPSQRKDFAGLADALYQESIKSYNAKRDEYRGISERNQLNTDDVLGPEPKMPAAQGGWSAKKVP